LNAGIFASHGPRHVTVSDNPGKIVVIAEFQAITAVDGVRILEDESKIFQLAEDRSKECTLARPLTASSHGVRSWLILLILSEGAEDCQSWLACV